MSTPVDPAVADAAVQAQLREQAHQVQGAPPAAIFGDQPPAAPQQMDLAGAHAGVVDAQKLLAQLQALADAAQAREDAANPPAEPADTTLRADPNAPGWLHDLIGKIETRMAALEHPENKPEPAPAVR
jgi:hypothetical protein